MFFVGAGDSGGVEDDEASGRVVWRVWQAKCVGVSPIVQIYKVMSILDEFGGYLDYLL